MALAENRHQRHKHGTIHSCNNPACGVCKPHKKFGKKVSKYFKRKQLLQALIDAECRNSLNHISDT